MAGERFHSSNPGRDIQTVGTADFLGQDPGLIHEPVWAVIGNQGDSQCYLGVSRKVGAVQSALLKRAAEGRIAVRAIDVNYAGGVSDGQLNGTDRMRFSLIGREVTNDGITLHLSGSDVKGAIAVVACDKPPVGTVCALAEHNEPAIVMSDGSVWFGTDPETGERIDIVTGFQVAGDPDQEKKDRIALNAAVNPDMDNIGSCGGMFTYNTMQSFIGALGMEPLHMVSPASNDKRRVEEFSEELVDYLQVLTEKNIKPRDIITPTSLRNAVTVALAVGGSTNVVLHAPEIARAAGIDFWEEVMSQDEFNKLSREVPVLTDARPYGQYSMVDIEEVGGLQVIVKELLDADLLDGSCITCTGETLEEQIGRLDPNAPDGEVVHSVSNPYKETGGLRILKGNLAPEGGAVIKVAGVEGGLEDGVFRGRARTFDSEAALIEALDESPDIFEDKDMVVIRYEGPSGAPGMPDMLDPTSRITTLCRERDITIALMTDARFSGGSVGLVVGHVSPEASHGGPIALVKDDDTIVVDLYNDTIDCVNLADQNVADSRKEEWLRAVENNGGVHPNTRDVDNRLLNRMRASASPALDGAGWSGVDGKSVIIKK